jgi:hypothetical protein
MRNIFKRGSMKKSSSKKSKDVSSSEEEIQQQYNDDSRRSTLEQQTQHPIEESTSDSSIPSYDEQQESYSMEEMPQEMQQPMPRQQISQQQEHYYQDPQHEQHQLPRMQQQQIPQQAVPMKKKKSKMGGLAKAGASAAVTDFIMTTVKKELQSEVGNNFDVWADRFLDIIDANTDLLKGKSIESAQLVKERIYFYDDMLRNKIGELMDLLLAKVEMLDETFGSRFNLAPGTIAGLATGWVEDLEDFVNQQLDVIVQLVEHQIDLFIGKAHQRIDIAKTRTYQQSRKLKQKWTTPVAPVPGQRQRRRPANVMM